MRTFLFLILILSVTACGSKKKITTIKQGYEYSNVTQKEAIQDTFVANLTDTTKTEIKAKETIKESVLESFIFDAKGTVTGYTRKTDRVIERDSQSNEQKGIVLDVFENHSQITNIDSIGGSGDYSKLDGKEKESSNPIYTYIGLGLLLAIVLIVLKKLYWK